MAVESVVIDAFLIILSALMSIWSPVNFFKNIVIIDGKRLLFKKKTVGFNNDKNEF